MGKKKAQRNAKKHRHAKHRERKRHTKNKKKREERKKGSEDNTQTILTKKKNGKQYSQKKKNR